MTSSTNEKGQFLDISEFFSNLTLLVALKIPTLKVTTVTTVDEVNEVSGGAMEYMTSS